jgi:primary-amine oxidase
MDTHKKRSTALLYLATAALAACVAIILFLPILAPAAPTAPQARAKAQPLRKPAQVASAATHPLDPLTLKEIAKALRVLKSAGKITQNSLLPYVVLKELPKNEVQGFQSGQEFRREAFVEIYQRDTGKLFESTVNLRKSVLADYHEVSGMQPSVMLSEFDAVPPIVKADPRFVKAMQRRGIKNLDDVAVDIWAYGSPNDDLSKSVRLLRAIAYYKGKNENFYARPIDGFTAIVNMNERRVESVLDTDVLPIPPDASDFDNASLARQSGGHLRPPLRPLIPSQPQGPEFTVQGNEIYWQNWRFRFGMHPREGLVLYQIQYHDQAVWRPIIYRASLAELMVPYGHNDQHWTYRCAFDEGEYGIGRYSGSLDVGADVPSNATLFDALFVDDFGKPYVTKNVGARLPRRRH